MAVWLEEMAKSLGRWMKVEECGRRLLRVFIRCSGHPTTATLCSPSTVMILWPLSLIFLITFLPHNLVFWQQYPIYMIVFKLLWRWCHFVADCKELQMKQQVAAASLPQVSCLPAVGVCTSGVLHLHTREPEEQGEVREDKEDSCRPFLWLGDAFKSENPEEAPEWLNTAISQVRHLQITSTTLQWWLASRAAMEDVVMNILWPQVRMALREVPVRTDIEVAPTPFHHSPLHSSTSLYWVERLRGWRG